MLKGNIDVSKLIKRIEADESEHIDSFVLSNLVRMVHLLCLKKGEMLNLKIGDVVDVSGNVVKQIKIGRREMPVSHEVESIINDLLNHLNGNDNYKVDRDSPLFQNKKGSVYTEAARQLRVKFIASPLEKIRQNGLKLYYAPLKSLGRSSQIKEMKKFTGLSDKEIMGIVKNNIPKPGKKREVYEKDSYMKTVLPRLQNVDDIDFSELLAIPEKLSDFKLDDLEEVGKLKNAYFNAVDGNVALNTDQEGVDEQIKDNSKKILKEWLLEKFHDVGIDFDANTNKAKKISKAEKIEEFKTAKDIYKAIKRLRPDLCDLFSQVDKARGIIYGLAIGDALGYPTEFMSLSRIKEKYGSSGIQDLTKTPAFFTDDTQMSIAIAEALIKAGDRDIEVLMAAVKDEFIKWYHSPENNRAPGKACLSGVANLEHGKHWSKSGVPNSKGCGSAMRVATIGYFYQNDPVKLKEVAHATGICTHGHPTGDAACIGAAYPSPVF
ncbi:ADP-ribosylglycohydrolase family protein [Thermodesulfobacteriota bacterium]